MVRVTVWCLPKQSADILEELYKGISRILRNHQIITFVKKEGDESILFPYDQMNYYLGRKIIVEVDDLPIQEIDPGKERVERNFLSRDITSFLKDYFPDCAIECRVYRSDPNVAVYNSD